MVVLCNFEQSNGVKGHPIIHLVSLVRQFGLCDNILFQKGPANCQQWSITLPMHLEIMDFFGVKKWKEV